MSASRARSGPSLPRRLRSAVLVGALASALPALAAGQTIPLVHANLSSRTFDQVLPFDQIFTIAVKLPSDVQTISLQYGPAAEYEDQDGTHTAFVSSENAGTQPEGLVRGDEVVFRVSPIRPNTRYLFLFRLAPKPGTTPPKTTSSSTTRTITRRTRGGTRSVATTVTTNTPPGPGEPRDAEEVPVVATATADLKTHFDTDFGVLWSPRPGPAYVGAGSNVHFYFVPINKFESLENRDATLRDQLFKRVSVFVGLAFVKLESKEPVENRFDAGNLVTGLGLRPRFAGSLRQLDFFRLNVGEMFFRQKNANPLLTDPVGAHAPFLSLTADIDLQTAFGPLLALLGAKK